MRYTRHRKEKQMTQRLYPDWRKEITYSDKGPQPRFLVDDDKLRALIGGLEPGQKIPEHAENAAVYHFLEGTGWMLVDGERYAVGSGATVIVEGGAKRGMEAETRLAFLAVRIK
jgi:quercetin dioxygenase-like cupin family protein